MCDLGRLKRRKARWTCAWECGAWCGRVACTLVVVLTRSTKDINLWMKVERWTLNFSRQCVTSDQLHHWRLAEDNSNNMCVQTKCMEIPSYATHSISRTLSSYHSTLSGSTPLPSAPAFTESFGLAVPEEPFQFRVQIALSSCTLIPNSKNLMRWFPALKHIRTL
jgi:hypothetical protein